MNYLVFTLLPHHWVGEGGSNGWNLRNATHNELTGYSGAVQLLKSEEDFNALRATYPKELD